MGNKPPQRVDPLGLCETAVGPEAAIFSWIASFDMMSYLKDWRAFATAYTSLMGYGGNPDAFQQDLSSALGAISSSYNPPPEDPFEPHHQADDK